MRRVVLLACLILLTGVETALAHSSARGFVLLLPVGYVIAGGALAVLLSFTVLSALPDRLFLTAEKLPRKEAARPRVFVVLSVISALFLLVLLYAGIAGPHDPAENLLPLAIWTLWWVVIVLLHPLFGNLWAAINPISGPHALLSAWLRSPRLRYPAWASYWPAVAIFLAFAWFQLVYPSPEDPDRLALAVAGYLAFTLAAALVFGAETWLSRGDPFAVFLSQLGAVSPLSGAGIRWPGSGLLWREALPLSGVLFVLLTLSTISFDGFANTFLWLSWLGVNPLDFPGRTALISANTVGLLLSFAVLAGAFLAAVALGWHWAGRPGILGDHWGTLVYSLIPISVAYHFAHYLPDALLNLQYLLKAIDDPLHNHANLLGLADWEVTASFLNTASGARAIFAAQTSGIIIGHIVGVAVAHTMVTRLGLSRSMSLKFEAPLALLMVAYTAFGLWLLGTPTAG